MPCGVYDRYIAFIEMPNVGFTAPRGGAGRTPLHRGAFTRQNNADGSLVDTSNIETKAPDTDGSAPPRRGVSTLTDNGEPGESLLATQSIDVNAQDRDGWTPLHFAVPCGQVVVIEHLLAAAPNIDVSLPSNEGITALDMARSCGNDDIYQMLLTVARGAEYSCECPPPSTHVNASRARPPPELSY